MAQIVVGATMPRGPQLRLPPARWPELAERDKTNPWLFDLEGNRTTYDDLLREAPPTVSREITAERWEVRYAAAQRAWQQVRQPIAEADPDVILVMGDDENELFTDDATRPKLAVYRGASWPWGDPQTVYPVATGLTDHVISHLRDVGYEIHVFDALPNGATMPHCFGNVCTDLMAGVKPVVPIMVNIHYPVNQTTPIESYRLGQVVRAAVESWPGDSTVGVAGIGGLSIGALHEDFDRGLLSILQNRDVDALADLPYRWIKGPSGEIYNWIGAAGILEGLEMRIVDYLPAYRSPAGTGCGMAFATWT